MNLELKYTTNEVYLPILHIAITKFFCIIISFIES